MSPLMTVILNAVNENKEVRVSMVDLLLSHGANVTLLNNEGMAAIHLAIRRESGEYVSNVL